MPIRGIHLKDVSITAKGGMVWMDAERITCENVEILNSQGPVLNAVDARNCVLDNLKYTPGAETVVKAQGDKNSAIVIRNTDLKSAKKDFLLSNGAVAEAFQVK